jgi:putative acetyltransferase
MEIRPEQPGEEEAISSIVTSAFATAEHSDGTEAAIVERLRKAEALTLSLVAEVGGEPVGHVAFSPVMIDGRHLGWFGLGPVAVRPDQQGLGIGSALIREGLERLAHLGAAGCVLVGEPAYYGRFGFAADAELKYPVVPAEFFLALGFTDEKPKGVVAYHPAFG